MNENQSTLYCFLWDEWFRASSKLLLKEQTLGIKDLLDRLQTFARRIVDGSIDQEELGLFKGYMEQDVVKNSLQLFEQGLQRPRCRFNRDRQVWTTSSTLMTVSLPAARSFLRDSKTSEAIFTAFSSWIRRSLDVCKFCQAIRAPSITLRTEN